MRPETLRKRSAPVDRRAGRGRELGLELGPDGPCGRPRGLAACSFFLRAQSPVRSALAASAAVLALQIGIDVHLRLTSDFYHGAMPPLPGALRALAVCAGLVAGALVCRWAWGDGCRPARNR